MNKIYIGNTEVANTGGGGGTIDTSGFVDVSTWDEHEKVIASALVDLKSLEDQIEAFDDKIEGHVEFIDTQIQTLGTNKADVSVVYLKKDINKADKVTAAALAELNDRVSTLESSSGSGSGGGSTPDLTNYIDYTTAENAGLVFGYQRNYIESISAHGVTGTEYVLVGEQTGNYIVFDPMGGSIDFSISGETGSISLVALRDLLLNS